MGLDLIWYGGHPVSLALAPLGWLFAGLVGARRLLYRLEVLPVLSVPAPVIVVGNIAVGGAGKTPLVIWLVELLRRAGRRPGVISRGHGGRRSPAPRLVTADSDPGESGDEPVLIARRARCPVVVAVDRHAAAVRLLETTDCDVVVADDGLQHLRLARDVEIAVVDGARRHGNGRCLPAGPLREPRSRLATLDLVVVNGAANADELGFELVTDGVESLAGAAGRCALADFAGGTVNAVAGIGNPCRFFRMLERHGLAVVPRPFPDHHQFEAPELEFDDGRPVLMTEKDAVKYRPHAGPQHWVVPVSVAPGAGLEGRCLSLLDLAETRAHARALTP